MNNRFVILGAGKNHWTQENSSFFKIGNERSLLNWQISTCEILNCRRIDYVAGYNVDSLRTCSLSTNSMHIVYNKHWEETNSLYSLLLLDFNKSENLFVIYNDILLEEEYIKKIKLNLSQDAITCLVDSTYPSRFTRNKKEAKCEVISSDGKKFEFVGFVHIPKKFFPFLLELQSKKNIYKIASMSQLLKIAEDHNIPTIYLDANGSWVDTNFANDFARFLFKGKAKSLERTRKLVFKSRFLEQFSFSTQDWIQKKDEIYKILLEKFGISTVVVRSSAMIEDGFASSCSGAFDSFLGIPLTQKTTFVNAVEQTIKSYGRSPNSEDLLLIQPFYNSGKIHGVLMTKSHEGGPYYVFNYVYGSNTEDVTKGVSKDHKTVFVLRSAPMDKVPYDLRSTLEAVQEIENALGFFELDVEFIVDEEGKCIILQVRPLVQNIRRVDEQDVIKAIEVIRHEIEEVEHSLNTYEGPNIFGVMPDWNPAEIIGHKPSPLALSLYKKLVTDSIWAQQRYEFGYSDLREFPLMHSFYGIPYINVKRSFISFLPRKLDPSIANVIIQKALIYLYENPHLHDKVEFCVMPTCYVFNFRHKFRHVLGGLSKEEIETVENLYKEIVFTAFHFDSKKQDYLPLELNHLNPLDAMICLIENCKKGVLAFAHEARRAFIATSLLQSLLEIGTITPEEMAHFFSSLHTVSQELLSDALLCKTNMLSFKDFVRKYGHLRPGTYDITSSRYDQNVDKYLRAFIENLKPEDVSSVKENFIFKNHQEIDQLLKTIHPSFSYKDFIGFTKEAIVSREKVKFFFSKDLSNILEQIASYGAQNSFSRSDMSYADLDILTLLKSSSYECLNRCVLDTFIKKNKHVAIIRNCVEMPLLLSDPDEIFVFSYPSIVANFITMQTVEGEKININLEEEQYIDGKVIFIENADPGYDWIFSHKIIGFVTMYGGINSHMAVRAAEKNIPAAIGVGPQVYNNLKEASHVLLDCKNKKLTPCIPTKNEKYFNYAKV